MFNLALFLTMYVLGQTQVTYPRTGRVDCGVVGTTAESCKSSGCIWSPLEPGSKEPWCFRPVDPLSVKIDCGFVGTTEQSCQASGCTWSPLAQGSKDPWCYRTRVISSRATPSVLFQAFDWYSIIEGRRPTHYGKIYDRLDEYKNAGFEGMWLPPMTESADPWGYLPTRWYNLVNETDIRKLTRGLRERNMLSLMDFVMNHRVGVVKDTCTDEMTKFELPDMGNWAIVSGDTTCGDSHPVECKDGCGCGQPDTGDNWCGSPDLDHSNDNVRALIKDFITWNRDNLGFDGFRIDMAKGYNGMYQAEYQSHWNSKFTIGEFWDQNLDNVKRYLVDSKFQIPVFDFALYFNLQNSITSNSFGVLADPGAGVIGLDTDLSVTFIGNHDVSRDNDFGNDDQILQGYAFILTHPGTPMVYYAHYEKQNIRAKMVSLIALRKELGITSLSAYTVERAEGGLYAAYITGTKGTIAMKLGTSDWSPPAEYALRLDGQQFAVWTLKN